MNYSQQEIWTHTKKILRELFDLDEALLIPEARLYEDLDIDSIDAVDLLIELKKIAGTNIKPDFFKEATTLQDVVNTIATLDNQVD
ncbi:MAG: acyl carrier protein [Cellvibrionaceae bacterium]|nr:acyl carrier protein [Cellvibrionaceae bacterium]